jgi:hypothetical protein
MRCTCTGKARRSTHIKYPTDLILFYGLLGAQSIRLLASHETAADVHTRVQAYDEWEAEEERQAQEMMRVQKKARKVGMTAG